MGLFDALFGRREGAPASLPAGPVRDFLETAAPSQRTPLAELRLLAVDVETTGLDPRRDALLSIGWVPVDGFEVVFAGAGSAVIRDPGLDEAGVGQSATVHGLTDDRLASGVPAREALSSLLAALRGRVLLAHHAPIELGFLGRACEREFGTAVAPVAVDTMGLQERIVAPGFDDEAPADSLRLWSARARFGMPALGAHDALHDALACAELYLAQVAELGLADADLKAVRSGRRGR